MIPVSMSRKTQSFGQLSAYMDSEKSDSRYDLHYNYFVRGRENIAGAFFENSKALKSRKNGNYLYHEIISITLEDGVDPKHAKEALREITLKYIQDRCPRNMVYGCLHEDHRDHLHYHLMISANEVGEQKRHWLTTKQYDTVKRDLETHVLENYPELKQRKIITAGQKEKKVSRKAAAEKRRTGKLERQEGVRDTIFRAMLHTPSLAEFKEKLKAQGFEYYRRGKHHGVRVTFEDGKLQNYRFATVGAAEAFEEYLKAIESLHASEDRPQEARERQSAQVSTEDTPQGEQPPEETREDHRKASRQEDTAPENEALQDAAEHSPEDHPQNAPESAEEAFRAAKATTATDPEEPSQEPLEAAEGQEENRPSSAAQTLKEMQERREERAERKRAKLFSRMKRKGKPRR